MADIETENSSVVASRIIIILLVVALAFTLISIAVITLITHNVYASSYYTLSSMFDSNGENSAAFISMALQTGSASAFDEFIAVSIIDGLAKAVIIGFVIAAFINLIAGIDLRSKFDFITAKHMKDHVIICGYSMLAERLCQDLAKEKIRFIVIEKDPEKVGLLRDLGLNVVEGNFTEKSTLEASSINNARAVVMATESDFTNLLGIVTAHHVSPDVKIISRARNVSSVTKMQRAGAELCLVPESVAGLELGESILKLKL